jgi:hypothetical protein
MTYDIEARRKNKMNSDDRVLVLRTMEGKKATDSAGKIDPRLFTGENRLHAIFDPRTGMWNMRYETGGLPGALQEKFLEFSQLEEAARKYFKTRNVEVVDVIS